MQSQLFFFKFHAHVEPYHQNMGLPARCLGSLFAKGWVILKDPLVCSWGVVPRRVEPKLVYYDSRVTSAYFKILKKKQKMHTTYKDTLVHRRLVFRRFGRPLKFDFQTL